MKVVSAPTPTKKVETKKMIIESKRELKIFFKLLDKSVIQ